MWVWSLLACNGGGPADGEAPTYHADVAPILAGRCVGCHQAGGIGTFPLESYAEVAEVGEIVAAVTESRQMPPWKAVPGHLAYANDPSLTEAQIATIADWVAADMPEGDPAEAGEPVPSLAVALPRVDHTLEMPEDYLPTEAGSDDYRCFVLDWPESDLSYVTGFDVHPGNDTIVHHVAAFLIRPDGLGGDGVIDTFTGWDAEDEVPGYSCFGGPSQTGSELQVPVQQVAQWVPGSGATLFPDGVGIPVPAGSLIVLQLHYNTLSADGNPDRTRLDLMTEPDVARVGAFAPWLDPTWTFGQMEIPAGSVRSHTAAGNPLGFFELLLGTDVALDQGFDIHAVMLHMHQLGQHAVLHHDPAGAERRTLLEVADWDFDWQLTYVLDEAVPFAPDDALSLTCTFDNTTGEAVNWGEGSGEEMCVANLFVSAPK
jgi:hypothetical protein